MDIEIKVIPGARRNLVKEEAGGLRVYVAAPPVDGKANTAVLEVLAAHFGVRPRRLEIIKGLQSRRKIIRINPS